MVVIDNVFSEGIDCKRDINGVKMLNITEKERNEQADLRRKEVMTSIDEI
jgi:hypothetical protein